MKKRIIAAGLGVFALSLAVLPPMSSMAEKTRMITWEKKNKNSVALYLELQKQEPADSLTAFSLDLVFESEEPLYEAPTFSFGDTFSKMTVHEKRYDEEKQTLTLYVADKDPVLEKGNSVLLGTIKVKGEENVTISVDEHNFQTVDTFFEKGFIREFGDIEPYEMVLKKPEETIPPETEAPETEEPETEEPEIEEPETEEPETEEPETEAEQDDEEEEVWTVRPNGSWRSDAKGWRFSVFSGTDPADSWYECAWDGRKGWYHFNSAGYMETGWFIDKDGNTYFLHDQNDSQIGAMYTGWHWIGDKCYYFREVGADGQPKGAMVKNGKTPDGYTVNEHGQWIIHDTVQVKPEAAKISGNS